MSKPSYNNNNLSLILGVAFVAAAVTGDFKKSNLTVGEYVSRRANEAVELVVAPASATAAPELAAK
jgi:hypothetical protein